MKQNNLSIIAFKFFIGFILPIAILNNNILNKTLTPFFTYFASLLPPILLGVYELYKERSVSYFSILGTISCVLNILIFSSKPSILIYALKEGFLPFVFFSLCVLTKNTTNDFLTKIITRPLNDITIEEIKKSKELNSHYNRTYYIVALSMLYSSVMNFVLAIYILKAAFGTEQFNFEVSKLNTFNLLLITIPTFIIIILAEFWLINFYRRSNK